MLRMLQIHKITGKGKLLVHMEDIKISVKSEKEMKIPIQKIRIYNQDIGME